MRDTNNEPIDWICNYIEYYIKVNDNLKLSLMDSFIYEEYKKGSHLTLDGERCNRLFFIVSGACRTYYEQNGKEVTSWIYPENDVVTNWDAFYSRKKSFDNIQALSDVGVYSITHTELQNLYDRHPEMERFGRKMMEQQLAFIDMINHEFIFSSAKERYDKILSLYPDIIKVANLGHIASFLGISQETLSRIRKMR